MATGILATTYLLVALSVTPAGLPANGRYDSAITRRDFNIPINIDPSRRNEIKELLLYVSTDQGRTWNEVTSASPDQNHFSYNAPIDGVYYFNLVIVDRQGRRDPSDIQRATPAMRILVDSMKPTVRINTAERQGDDIIVSWDVQDENLDPSSLKLEYHASDMAYGQWNPIAINATPTGQTRFRVSTPSAISVRMMAMDQARNVGQSQAEVTARPQTTSNSAYRPAPSPVGYDGGPQRTTTAYRDPQQSYPQQSYSQPSYPQQSSSSYVAAPVSANPLPTPGYPGYDGGGRLVASSELNAAVAGNANARPRGALPPLHIVNSTQVTLDYELSKVGPSGVGRVELWLTQDDGRTWRRYAEDTDLHPPITVDLPGEGVYGFCIVVQSKAGLGKRAPVSGDIPELRIEVDSTQPVAKLYAPEPDPKHPNTLLVTWQATDRNLTNNPISLQWAEKPTGPWENIGADLPNTGKYTWTLPNNLPYRVYLRLVARDNAGNTCMAETPEPVLVDLNEPEGRLLGISALSRRP
jgi:hypothetical protein